MIDHKPGFISLFLSASLDGLSAEDNRLRNAELADRLRQTGMMVDRVHGQYQGVAEESFRVCLNGHSFNAAAREHDTVMALAREFWQESVLLVLRCGAVYLWYLGNATPAFIGQWSRVRVDELDQRDYSCISGEYFTVRTPS